MHPDVFSILARHLKKPRNEKEADFAGPYQKVHAIPDSGKKRFAPHYYKLFDRLEPVFQISHGNGPRLR
jgi:hypothetical protein